MHLNREELATARAALDKALTHARGRRQAAAYEAGIAEAAGYPNNRHATQVAALCVEIEAFEALAAKLGPAR